MQRVSLVGLLFLIACGSSWPERATVVATTSHGPDTIEVAPIALALVLEPGAHASGAQVQSTATARLANGAIAALEARQYNVQRSGADATLYVEGRSFVPAPRPSRAHAVAATATSGMLVAAAVLGASAAVGGLDADEREYGERSSSRAVWRGIDAASTIASDMAFVIAADAAWEGPTLAAPPPGMPAGLELQMTLVENRSGRVLWQAHQRFPANATSSRELARAAATLLATLPPPAPRS